MHQISGFLEMGANIPYNSHFPGYYSTRNHNLIINGSKLNHNLSPDQLLGYYNEALKHTMLTQETMLRDQIQDLHRLYGRQRELMDEFRRNELDKHQLKMETSRLTTVVSQSSSLCVQKTFRSPPLPLVNPVCSQISVLGPESIHSPSCFVRGRNIQACSNPSQTEDGSGDCVLLESKCKEFQKNFFDLQLPADDAYTDKEELLGNGKFSEAPEVTSSYMKRLSEAPCNGDVKQSLATNGFSSVSEDDSSTTASLGKVSSDLNYLFKLEEETSPAFDNFLGPTSHRETPCSDVSRKTKSLSKELIQDTTRRQDFEVCSNAILQDRKNKQEWSSSTYEAGKSQRTLNSFHQGFHAEKSSESSLLHAELKQAELPAFHQRNQNSWSERTMFGLQNSRRNSSQSGPTGASSMGMAYRYIPEDEMVNSGSSCIANVPIAAQAFPCFNTRVPFSNSAKPSMVRHGHGDRIPLKTDLRSSTLHGRAFFQDSSFSDGSQLELKNSEAHPPHISFDNLIRIGDNLVSEHHTNYIPDSANAESQKHINLNCVPLGCSLDVAVSQSFQARTGSEKVADSYAGLPWHRPKLVYNGKADGCEDSNQAQASHSSSKRIHGSTTSCEKPTIYWDHCSHGSPSNANLNPPEDVKKRKAVVLDLNLACDSMLDAEKELAEHVVENEFDKEAAGFGFRIDLNSSINGDELSPMPSLSTEIVLEAPVSPENKECSPPRGESDQNQVETPFLLSGQEDLDNKECFPPIGESNENQIETPLSLPGQEDLGKECFQRIRESDENENEASFRFPGESGQKVDLEEELVRTAAESLAFISSSGPHTYDSLHWFSGIASAVVGGPDNKAGVVFSEEFLPDGMDYFEVMTLNLTETKVEDCLCRIDVHKEEEMGSTLPQNQPRKGRRRRGRQRKDFQSEVLPSIASLTRYEVTEDLQTIEGLIESCSDRWETGSVRYATKAVLARGRKRSSISTSPVTENTLESVLKQIGSKNQIRKEERKLVGWGEVTRRRRGQRYPVSKPGLILSQV